VAQIHVALATPASASASASAPASASALASLVAQTNACSPSSTVRRHSLVTLPGLEFPEAPDDDYIRCASNKPPGGRASCLAFLGVLTLPARRIVHAPHPFQLGGF
jgi:hypothetical protein